MSPPYRLPPLNALRAFEVAARQLSFVKAGAELNVTPAAVSQQIKKLEEYFQVQLFRRKNRHLALTYEAQLIPSNIRDGFEKISSSVRSIQRRKEHGFITVSATPAFASKWLVPRLNRWVSHYPETDIRISASLDLADFERTGIDLSIRFGIGSYPALSSTFFNERELCRCVQPCTVNGQTRDYDSR